MEKINLVKIVFGLKAGSALFGGVLINFFEKFLPNHFRRFYRNGRFNDAVECKLVEKLEVPKRWFKHFYAFAAPYAIFTLMVLCYRYFLNGTVPNAIVSFWKIFLGTPLQSLIPPEHALLAMFIFSIHCCKRYYETHYINVFSDVTINLFIYIIGLSHYFGGIMSIIGDSQDISTDKQIILNWTRLTWMEYTCAIVFLISTYLQYRTNIILANLRRNEKGVVVTKKYRIPTGELFKYVTAPLQFTEIILYICMSIILRNASTFHYVTIWTIINQVESAYLAHEWALKKFDSYPKSRKIIIPFIF